MTAVRKFLKTGDRRPGRPRSLTLSQIARAGAEIGLSDLTINTVAVRLGVGAATIYNYVGSTDQLRRIVTVLLMARPGLEEHGQHWAEVVRAHALNTFRALSDEPEILVHYISGAVAPGEFIENLETFLQLLKMRGFSLTAAYDLFRVAGLIAMGAAVAEVTAGAHKRHGESRAGQLAAVLALQPDDAMSCVRALGDLLIQSQTTRDFVENLEKILAQTAADRGEDLPPPDAGMSGADGTYATMYSYVSQSVKS